MSGNYTIIEVANMAGIPVNTVRSRLKNGYYNGTYNFTDNNGNKREFTVTEDDIKDISKKGSKRKRIRLTPNFLQAVILDNEHKKNVQKLLNKKNEIKVNSNSLAIQLGQRILELFNGDKNLENNDALNEIKLAEEIAVEFDNRYVDKYRKKLRSLELKRNALELKYNDLELKYRNLKSENNNIKDTYRMAATDFMREV